MSDPAQTPTQSQLAPYELGIGSLVGDYVVTGTIGWGGMATVYSARHPLIGKQVAVKVISKSLSGEAEQVERFLQEARCVNRISHPNIVDVFNWGALPDGRSYFVMEWLPGEALSASIDAGTMPFAQRLDVLIQICDALEAAHAHGVVHRDLKPDNIFLVPMSGRQPLVKLLDFGLAKLTIPGETPARLTRIGLTMGTPEYISPEQARGRDVDHRTDIYALGVVAYELLVGRLPFIADSAADTLAMHLGELPPLPSSIRPGFPAALETLVLEMLEKDPELRPDLSSIRARLCAARRQPSVTAGDDDILAVVVERCEAEAGLVHGSGVHGEVARRSQAPRRSRLSHAAGLALVALSGALAAVVLQHGGGATAGARALPPALLAAVTLPSTLPPPAPAPPAAVPPADTLLGSLDLPTAIRLVVAQSGAARIAVHEVPVSHRQGRKPAQLHSRPGRLTRDAGLYLVNPWHRR